MKIWLLFEWFWDFRAGCNHLQAKLSFMDKMQYDNHLLLIIIVIVIIIMSLEFKYFNDAAWNWILYLVYVSLLVEIKP